MNQQARGSRSAKQVGATPLIESHVLVAPQWVQCDLRNFDYSVLGKFSVVMADPPWDIHMELPYGTMADDEMRKLPVPSMQVGYRLFDYEMQGAAAILGLGYVLWSQKVRITPMQWINARTKSCFVRVRYESK